MSETHNRLCQFLSQHRSKDTSTTTHVGMHGSMVGKYQIDTEESKAEFLRLYKDALKRGEPLTIAESHEELSPVLVDLDLKYNLEGGFMRKFSTDDIVRVLDLYRTAMRQCLNVEEKDLVAYVFQKFTPRRSKGIMKDGIHIIFPYVITGPYVQYEIRDRVIRVYESEPIFREVTNNAKDIFDKAIIYRNSWLMVGSAKSADSPAYHLSHVLDAENINLSIPPLDVQVETCMIRGHEIETPLKDDLDVNALREKYGPVDVNANTPDTVVYTTVSRYTSMDIEYAKNLVKILDPRRADSYVQWMELGWCLHNISRDFLSLWDDFSSKSSKYKPGECERQWLTFRENGLGLGSLCMWAKEDNPSEYFTMRNESEAALVEQALTLTHFDVAKLVYAKFRHEFVCVSARDPQVWYQFKDHRWVQTQKGAALRYKIMEDISVMLKTLLARHTRRLMEMEENGADATQIKLYKEHMAQYRVLYKNLGTRRYVEDVVHVCSDLFLDPHFRQRQDANPYLLGFNNGVLDLQNMVFREGRPEDYVTLTTGYDFHWIHEFHDDPKTTEVFEFLQQILPNPEVCEYVLTLLSSMMFGKNIEQKAHIWTGAGSNGKSTLVDLYEKAMGEYATKLPVSLITGKRTSSSSATPELAKTVGRRFASMQEPESSDKLNVGLIKELSGGDTIVARPLYCEPFEFTPVFKIILMCNRLPIIPSTDGGTWRRLRVVHFPSKFVDNPTEPNEYKKNRNVSMKLDDWKVIFMAILVEKFRKHRDNLANGEGVHEPAEVRKQSEEYQKKSNVVLEFVDAMLDCTGIARDRVEFDLVYSEFKHWFTNSYNNIPMNKPDFKDELFNQRIDVKEKYMVGVRLKANNDENGGEYDV